MDYIPWGRKEWNTTEQLSLSLFRCADDTILMAESEEELKSLFMREKEENEKASLNLATHSSILAWRIPGMEEPSGLPSMGSHRVGHD